LTEPISQLCPFIILDVFYMKVIFLKCRLGGVVVNVLATGPEGRGFEPYQNDRFLRVIEVFSTPSFGWEVKLEVPCLNFMAC
jgi:hypothetical protein